MVKANWGIKRGCRKCGENFYDLKKDPIECPKCLATFSANDFASKYAKSSEGRGKKVAAFEEVVLIDDSAIDEDILEDASDLEDDVVDVVNRDDTDDESDR